MSQSSTSDGGGSSAKGRSPFRQPLPLLPRRGFLQTRRKDFWWITPLIVIIVFGTFIVYSTWAAFQGIDYRLTTGGIDYLSPLYSPELFGSARAWFGAKPGWYPGWIPWSPALLILWAPGGFRFTCYYYRGAYYKAFWSDPSSCTVGEPRNSYWGEKKLPLILQNVHRYFMYLAVIFLVILAWDVWNALWLKDATGTHFHIGLGTLIMAVDVVLLSCYTFGCHSLRHLIGGAKDEISKSACGTAYKCVSCFNRRHMLFAWCSLFSVGFTDLYIRLCCKGIWHDWRIF